MWYWEVVILFVGVFIGWVVCSRGYGEQQSICDWILFLWSLLGKRERFDFDIGVNFSFYGYISYWCWRWPSIYTMFVLVLLLLHVLALLFCSFYLLVSVCLVQKLCYNICWEKKFWSQYYSTRTTWFSPKFYVFPDENISRPKLLLYHILNTSSYIFLLT